MAETVASPQTIKVTVPVSLAALIRPEPEAGGFSAEIPALPGCLTQGETLEETIANLREAAQGWLQTAHEHASSLSDSLEDLP